MPDSEPYQQTPISFTKGCPLPIIGSFGNDSRDKEKLSLSSFWVGIRLSHSCLIPKVLDSTSSTCAGAMRRSHGCVSSVADAAWPCRLKVDLPQNIASAIQQDAAAIQFRWCVVIWAQGRLKGLGIHAPAALGIWFSHVWLTCEVRGCSYGFRQTVTEMYLQKTHDTFGQLT